MLNNYTPKNILRVGYIGLGNHALENLLPSILLTPQLQLQIISTRDENKLNLFATKFNPKLITTNWKSVINPELVDLVVVSAIPQIHYEVAKKCLESNIHIFIEKPPTQNLSQLQDLLSLKKETNVKTFVGYNFSFSDSYNKLLEVVSKNTLKLAKFRFIAGKMNMPMDGFTTVLESCLYKLFIHPVHTLFKTFGSYETLEISEQIFDENKFSMQVYFTFKNGETALIDWGNYSNRFECKFELTNQFGETGILDNMGKFEFWNMKNYTFDNHLFKNKERLVFDNSPLLGGYQRTGYQREFELFATAIIENKQSACELEQSLEVYRAIEEILYKSQIGF
jgi:predicted dehydrogenase